MAAQGWTPVAQDTSVWKPVAQPQKGFLSSFADSSGLSALAHPIDTILGIPAGLKQMAKDSVSNVKQGVADYQKEGLTEKTRRDFGRAVPIAGPALATAQGQHDAGNDAGMAGTIAGTVAGLAGPEALKAVKPAAILDKAAPALRATGEAAQETAGGIVNRAAGTLKSDFKRGANPGRGYLTEGGGVATSMGDLAQKSRAAVNDVGTRIGDLYKHADATGKLVPFQNVYDAIATPLKEAYDIATGPGAPEGLKTSLEHHADTFKSTLEKGVQNGGFTPSEVWDLKQRLAKSTNWSDATNLGMKQIRQQQVGQLSGVLKDAVPGLADANQSYMDLLKMAGRAEERAATGSKPITGHLRDIGAMVGGGELFGGHSGGLEAAAGVLAAKAARSIPARTAAATGIFKAGQGLTSIADRIDALRAASKGPTSTVIGNPVSEQAASSALNPNIEDAVVVSGDPRRRIRPVILPVRRDQN